MFSIMDVITIIFYGFEATVVTGFAILILDYARSQYNRLQEHFADRKDRRLIEPLFDDEGFFEEPFAVDYSARVTDLEQLLFSDSEEEMLAFYHEMDQIIADNHIFLNTEEL